MAAKTVMKFQYKILQKKTTIVILGLIGFCILLFLILSKSVGITPDSVAYISVARNIAEGAGFVTSEGSDYILQPPFYPLVLALAKTTLSIDPLVFAGYLNAMLFGGILIISGLFLLKHIKSFLLILLGITSIMISYALVQTSMFAMSESLFIFLSVLFLYYLDKYQSDQSPTTMIYMSITGSLACLTRYTGIVIILTGVICIILWGRTLQREKVKHLSIFLLITLIPIGLWTVRNYYLSGAMTGQRARSSYTILDNLTFFYQTILSWFLPVNAFGNFLFIIFLTGILSYIIRLFSGKSLHKNALKLIIPSLFFVILYSGIIIISSSTTAYDQISNRLLSPIFITIIIIIFYFFDRTLIWLKERLHKKLATVLFTTCVLLFIFYPVRNTFGMVNEFHQSSSEYNYNSAIWRESETIKYLSKNELLKQKFEFYSNEPEAVYILTSLKTKRSPAKTFYNSPKPYDLYINPRDDMQMLKNVCLIWFDKSNRDFLFTIEELQKKTVMTEIAHLKDGDIYTFSNK